MRCLSVRARGCPHARRGSYRVCCEIPHVHRTQLRIDRKGASCYRLQLPQVRVIHFRKIDAGKDGPQAFGNNHEEKTTRLPKTIIANAPVAIEI